jgi:CBS-domain-containing membrane protein
VQLRYVERIRVDVRKHMSISPITICDDTDFKSALGLMQKHRIRHLPVVGAGGVLTGIVAERDLLVAADHYLTSPVDVARIMTRQVVTIGDTTPVLEAAMLMIERKISSLPIVDQSRKLLGIITETDLLRALAAMLRREDRSGQATKLQRLGAQPKAAAAREKSASKRPVAARPKAKPKSAKSKKSRKRPPVARKSKSIRRAGSR